MEDKIILGVKQMQKCGDFVLNLRGIDDRSAIDLDFGILADKFNESLKNDNIQEAENFYSIARALPIKDEAKAEELGNKLQGQKLINEYKNIHTEDYLLKLKLYEEISSYLYRVNIKSTTIFTEELKSIIEELNNIKDNININQCIQGIHNVEISIGAIELLKKFLQYNHIDCKDEIKNIIDSSEKDMEYKFDKIKKSSYVDARCILKKMFENKYPEGFLVSSEFSDILIEYKYNKIENYEALLDYIDREYLIYKFNKGQCKQDKIEALYSMKLMNYIVLNENYKEYIVESLLKERNKYYSVQQFFNTFNKVMQDIQSNNKEMLIPV